MKTACLLCLLLAIPACGGLPTEPTRTPTCTTIAEYQHETVCQRGVCTLLDVGDPTFVQVCN